jgi:menaquinone-9 beta-reductase
MTMMNDQVLHTDVCIIGAGPGGAATALQLARMGVHSIVVDKAVFPRDKICGDGLSGKVFTILNRIDPEIGARLRKFEGKSDSWGVTFVAPNRIGMDIPLKLNYEQHMHEPVGFVSKRLDFDNFLVEELRRRPEIRLMEGVAIEQYEQTVGGWMVAEKGGKGVRIEAKLLVVANGAHSSFARNIAGLKMDPDHHCAGVRAYYRGVKGMHRHNFIELHFLKGVLPGYFWIFPLPNGEANVGLGMLSSAISKGKKDLRAMLDRTIAEDPVMKERFNGAERIGGISGYGLPLGGERVRLYGPRYMLVGDAGHLIDPFTGEGIGNALYAGHYAAKHAAAALARGGDPTEELAAYESDVYRVLGPELNISHKLQQMVRYPWLFNFLMRIGARNQELRELMTCMFNDVDLRHRFRDPRFYLRLLFGRGK